MQPRSAAVEIALVLALILCVLLAAVVAIICERARRQKSWRRARGGGDKDSGPPAQGLPVPKSKLSAAAAVWVPIEARGQVPATEAPQTDAKEDPPEVRNIRRDMAQPAAKAGSKPAPSSNPVLRAATEAPQTDAKEDPPEVSNIRRVMAQPAAKAGSKPAPSVNPGLRAAAAALAAKGGPAPMAAKAGSKPAPSSNPELRAAAAALAAKGAPVRTAPVPALVSGPLPLAASAPPALAAAAGSKLAPSSNPGLRAAAAAAIAARGAAFVEVIGDPLPFNPRKGVVAQKAEAKWSPMLVPPTIPYQFDGLDAQEWPPSALPLASRVAVAAAAAAAAADSDNESVSESSDESDSSDDSDSDSEFEWDPNKIKSNKETLNDIDGMGAGEGRITRVLPAAKNLGERMLSAFAIIPDVHKNITLTRDALFDHLNDRNKISRWREFRKEWWANMFSLAFPYIDAFRPACRFPAQDNFARGEIANAPNTDNFLFSNKYSDVRQNALLSFQNMWRYCMALPQGVFIPEGRAAAAAALAPLIAGTEAADRIFNKQTDTKLALALAAIQYGQVCILIEGINDFEFAGGRTEEEFNKVVKHYAELQETNKQWVHYALDGFVWDPAEAARDTILYLGARVARLDLPRARPDTSSRLAASLLPLPLGARARPASYSDARFRQLDEVRKHLLVFARSYAAQRASRYRHDFKVGIRSQPSAIRQWSNFKPNDDRHITYDMDNEIYDLFIEFNKITKASPGLTLEAWCAKISTLNDAQSSIISKYINEDLLAAYLAVICLIQRPELEYPLRRPPDPPPGLSPDDQLVFTRRFARPIRKMYHVALGRNGLYATRNARLGLAVALNEAPDKHSLSRILVSAVREYDPVGVNCRQMRAQIKSMRKTLRDSSTDAERRRLQTDLNAEIGKLDGCVLGIETGFLPNLHWNQRGVPVTDANTTIALSAVADALKVLLQEIGRAETIVFTTANIIDNQDQPRTEARLQNICDAIHAACENVIVSANTHSAVLNLTATDLEDVRMATTFIKGLADELLHGNQIPNISEPSGVGAVASIRPPTAAAEYASPPSAAETFEWKSYSSIENELDNSDYKESSNFAQYSEPHVESEESVPVVIQFDSMELLKSNANSVYNFIGRTSGSKLAPVLYGLVLDNTENGKTLPQPPQAAINELMCRIGIVLGIRAPVDRSALPSERSRPLKGWLVRYRPGSAEHFEIVYVRSDNVTGSSIQNFTRVSKIVSH